LTEIDSGNRLTPRKSASMSSLQREKKMGLFREKPHACLHLLRSSCHRNWSTMEKKARKL
jgi:hypothetical protein